MTVKGIKYKYEIDVKNQKALGQLLNDTESLNDSTQKTSSSLGKGAIALGFVTAAAATAGIAIKGLAEASKETATQLDLATGFARNFGQDVTKNLGTLRTAARNTISDMNLMQSANRAALLGVTKDTETLSKLLTVARLRGKEMGLDVTQAFDNIVTGIGRGSPLILDNLGITIPDAFKKAAEGMSEAEQKQALVNLVLEDGSRILEEYGTDAITASDKIAMLSASKENLKVATGDIGLSLLHTSGLLDLYTSGVQNLTNSLISAKPHVEILAQTINTSLSEALYNARGEQDQARLSAEQLQQRWFLLGGAIDFTINESIGRIGAFMGEIRNMDGQASASFGNIGLAGLKVLDVFDAVVGGVASGVNAVTGMVAGTINFMTGAIASGINGTIAQLNAFISAANVAGSVLGMPSIPTISAKASGTSLSGTSFSGTNIGDVAMAASGAAAGATKDFLGNTTASYASKYAQNQLGSSFGNLGGTGSGSIGGASGSGSGNAGGSGSGKSAQEKAQEEIDYAKQVALAKINAIKDEKTRLIELARFKKDQAIAEFNATEASAQQKADYRQAKIDEAKREIAEIEERFAKLKEKDKDKLKSGYAGATYTSGNATTNPKNFTFNITGNNFDSAERVDQFVRQLAQMIDSQVNLAPA